MSRSLLLVCLLAAAAEGAINSLGDQDKSSQSDSLLPSLLQSSRFNLMRIQPQDQEQQPREDYYDLARDEDRRQEQFRNGFQPRTAMFIPAGMPSNFQGSAMRFIAPSFTNRGQIFVVDGDAYDDGTVTKEESTTGSAAQWPAIVRPVEPTIPRRVIDSSSENAEEKVTEEGTTAEIAENTEASTSAPETTEEVKTEESTKEEVKEEESTTEQSVEATTGQEPTEAAPKEETVKADDVLEEANDEIVLPKEKTKEEGEKVEESTEEPKDSTTEEVKSVPDSPKEETEAPTQETQAPMDALLSAELPKGEEQSTATFETPKEEDVVLIDTPKNKEQEEPKIKTSDETVPEEILTTETPKIVETEPLKLPMIAGRFSRT